MKIKLNKKRLAALLLAGTMTLTMSGCGSDKESKEPSDYWTNTTVEDNNNEQEINDYYEENYEDPEDSLNDFSDEENSNDNSSSTVSFSNEQDTTSYTYLMLNGASTTTIDEGDGLYTDISYYQTDEYGRYMIPDNSYSVTLDGKYTYTVNCNYNSTINIGQNGTDSNFETVNNLDINNLSNILSSRGYTINSITNNSSNVNFTEDCIQVYDNGINTEVYDNYFINRITIYEDDYYNGTDNIYTPLKNDGYTTDIVIGDNSLTIKNTKTYDNAADGINALKNNLENYYGEDKYNDEYNSILENGTLKVVESEYLTTDNNQYTSYSYYVNGGLVLCFGKDSSGNEMYDDSYGIVNNTNTDANNVQFTFN